jgi:hypothetical protein
MGHAYEMCKDFQGHGTGHLTVLSFEILVSSALEIHYTTPQKNTRLYRDIESYVLAPKHSGDGVSD